MCWFPLITILFQIQVSGPPLSLKKQFMKETDYSRVVAVDL